jgi:hypothetical protein
LTATLKIKYNTTQICIRGLLRKNSVRIAKYWNKLPDNITNAPSTNAFKNRLIDKHWKDEDIYSSNAITEFIVNIKKNGELSKCIFDFFFFFYSFVNFTIKNLLFSFLSNFSRD